MNNVSYSKKYSDPLNKIYYDPSLQKTLKTAENMLTWSDQSTVLLYDNYAESAEEVIKKSCPTILEEYLFYSAAKQACDFFVNINENNGLDEAIRVVMKYLIQEIRSIRLKKENYKIVVDFEIDKKQYIFVVYGTIPNYLWKI